MLDLTHGVGPLRAQATALLIGICISAGLWVAPGLRQLALAAGVGAATPSRIGIGNFYTVAVRTPGAAAPSRIGIGKFNTVAVTTLALAVVMVIVIVASRMIMRWCGWQHQVCVLRLHERAPKTTMLSSVR